MTAAVSCSAVPGHLAGRLGVLAQRAAGRRALSRALSRTLGEGAPDARDLSRTDDGAPAALEHGGSAWHWSVAHTACPSGGLAVAAVARTPVGVDVESLDRPRIAPAEAFADAGELELLSPRDDLATLRLWTAKEALVKRAGCGIAELRDCRLERVSPRAMVLRHRGRRRRVIHHLWGRHVVAVAGGEPAR